ncbi:MAG: TRAP transporter substrate-binding protein DctP [Pseudoflavonifractor sp.]|nr:TRAP transporter substrate-binding protein DctP [Pseudoflavonifractor sp.]
MALTSCSSTPAANSPSGSPNATSDGKDTTKDDKVYELIYSTINGTNSAMYQNVDAPLMRAIEKASNGRIKFVEYLGGTLAASGEGHNAVLDGTCDVTFDAPAWYSGVFPLSILLEQGLGFASGEALSWVYYDLIHEYKAPEYDDLVVLAPMCSGPRALVSNKPVKTLKDWSGLQIRTNSSMAAVVKAWGGTPVTMGTSEVYEALQNHLVDGGIFSYESMTGSKYYEVCNYITDLSMLQATVCIYMSKEKYNSLPADLQKIITDTSYDFFVSTSSKFYSNYTDQGMETAEKANSNIEWIKLDDATRDEWTKALSGLTDSYVDSLDSMGIDGKAALKWINDKYQHYVELYPAK